jgi:hypothetical protein
MHGGKLHALPAMEQPHLALLLVYSSVLFLFKRYHNNGIALLRHHEAYKLRCFVHEVCNFHAPPAKA